MITLIEQGGYTLIETRSQTKILQLEGQAFAWIWVKGIGELLVSSHAEHKTDHILAQGKYYLYDVQDEPELTDLQHLELATGDNSWQGYLLPTGLPERQKIRSRIIPTTEKVVGSGHYIQSLKPSLG